MGQSVGHLALKKTKRTLAVFVLCGFYLLAPVSVYAVDCSTDDGWPSIYLVTQTDVDNFQDVYGPCDTITRDLGLSGTFANFDGLSDIIHITGDLGFGQMAVPGLSTFPNLLMIDGNLSFSSTTGGSNSSLSAFPALTSLGGLSIDDSNHITSLSGLTSLTTLGSIKLFNVRNLPDLTGLPVYSGVAPILSFGSMDMLQSLDGLSAVTGVQQFLLEDNPMLTSISALAGSVFSDTYDHPFDQGIPNLSISNNPKLSSLNGVPSVLPPGSFGTLIIGDAPLITSLNVLDGVVEVWGDFGIFENSALSDCSSLTKLLDEFDDSFPGPNDFSSDPFAFPPDVTNQFYPPTLQSNAAGCRSIAEILGRSSEDGVFMDSFETK